mgnify:CR=1 FL=1
MAATLEKARSDQRAAIEAQTDAHEVAALIHKKALDSSISRGALRHHELHLRCMTERSAHSAASGRQT